VRTPRATALRLLTRRNTSGRPVSPALLRYAPRWCCSRSLLPIAPAMQALTCGGILRLARTMLKQGAYPGLITTLLRAGRHTSITNGLAQVIMGAFTTRSGRRAQAHEARANRRDDYPARGAEGETGASLGVQSGV